MWKEKHFGNIQTWTETCFTRENILEKFLNTKHENNFLRREKVSCLQNFERFKQKRFWIYLLFDELDLNGTLLRNNKETNEH